MGNISSLARACSSTALDSYVAELGNDLSYDRSLSSSRFLKSIIVRHANGPLVLKIFIKPDAAMSLRVIQRRLKFERDAMAEIANINTYQAFVETDKAGYLIRQWIGSNLYDRLSLQPYLADVEKKWIAFQILDAMRDARLRKVGHGDIKSENILITSDLTVQMTDFSASYKPTFLPLDDPSEFDFFFDTSGRRACYIAPERIYSSDSDIAHHKQQLREDGPDADNWGKRDGKVTEEMDVFSVGCVLAEMWADGKTVFDLGELYKYRNGLVDIRVTLSRIAEPEVRAMIGQMMSLNPKDRLSFERILTDNRGTIFPEYFYTFLQEYLVSLSELASAGPADFLTKNASSSGNKIDRMLDEWESILVHLDEAKRSGSPCGPALLLLNVVSSSIRNASWPSSRLHGLQLFLNLLPYLTDEEKVDRVVPFAVELLSDEAPIVRAEACRVIVLVLESVQSVNQANITFIPEYLIPQMRHLASDADIFVRATYARGLFRIADAAMRMLELSQAAKPRPYSTMLISLADYDTLLLEVQAVVEEQVSALLVDSSSNVKRAMLDKIEAICLFFGRQKANETVLSHIMTYLNDRDWILRMAFFDGIVSVGAFIGTRAVEEYVLPLMLQALADPEEAVVARVIASLTTLAALGSLPRMRLWDVFFALRGLTLHPNSWIRQGSAGFIAATARHLPKTDVWCILYPLLRPLLAADVLELDESSILSALIPPLSRAGLIAARAAALQRSPPSYWDVSSAPGASRMYASNVADIPTASHALRDKGISSSDEKAVGYMKEFILKSAYAGRGREASAEAQADLTAAKSVSLTDLGVTPQTIFISPRTIRVSSKPQPRLLDGANSRRTSFAAKSAKSIDNPLEEIRRRLVSIDLPARASDHTPSDIASALPETAPSESAVSSTLDLVALGRKKRLDSKAAPAVSASHTTAMGMTTIHDDLMSGRETPSTPKGAAPVYGSSYEGQDPSVREFLDQVDLETYREPLLDFGPKVIPGARRRGSRSKSNTQGGVTMIAHLAHHTAAITSIVTAPDHLFFATASEDGTVLIWDSVRLERSVSAKPRMRHLMNAPITAMCRIEGTHCLAVAAEDGQLHVLRVHTTSSGGSTKYGRLECIRTWKAKPEQGHVVSISHVQDTSSLLIVTSTSVIAVINMRNMEISTQFQHPLELDVVTSVCPSAHWLVVGTASGSLSLWDLRFGLLLKTWRAGGAVLSTNVHPSKGKGRWVIVSTEREKESAPAAEVYDIETSGLVEIYEVRQSKPSKTPSPLSELPSEAVTSKAEMIARLGAAKDPFAPSTTPPSEESSSSVTAVAVGQKLTSLLPAEGAPLLSSGRTALSSEPGYMVTAGEDRVVRFWDLGNPTAGFVICGSQREKEVTFNTRPGGPQLFYTMPSASKQPSDPRHAGVASSRQPLRPHYDTVCALGVVETPFSSCVISADRSGVVKVWRLE